MNATVLNNRPCTIAVSGLPGAGKTALINHIGKNNAGSAAAGCLIVENSVTDTASLPNAGNGGTRVAVIDCFNFIADYSDMECPEGHHGQAHALTTATRELLQALMQAAHVIVLNKTDMVSAAQLTMIKFISELINEQALITTCAFGKIPEAGIIFSHVQNAQTTQGI